MAPHTFLLLNFSSCVLISVPYESIPSLFLHLLPDRLFKDRHHFPVSEGGSKEFCRMEKGPVKMVPEIIQLFFRAGCEPPASITTFSLPGPFGIQLKL